MPDQIYDKEKLRKRVLALLRQCDTHQTKMQVSQALGVQYWAVEQALEDAWQGREATFAAGAGWQAVDLPSVPIGDDAPALQGVLVS